MVVDIIKRLYARHNRVIFNGNNYSTDWIKEARRRGLRNIKSCVDAYEYLIERRSVNLFEKHKVMSEVELLSRREIYLDIYNKIINVEARTMLMMVKHEIIPAIIDYKDKLANAIIKLNKIDSTYSNVEQNLLKNFG